MTGFVPESPIFSSLQFFRLLGRGEVRTEHVVLFSTVWGLELFSAGMTESVVCGSSASPEGIDTRSQVFFPSPDLCWYLVQRMYRVRGPSQAFRRTPRPMAPKCDFPLQLV